LDPQPPSPERPDPVKPADAAPAAPPAEDAPAAADGEAAPPPPLTPLAWFKQNGWFYVALAVLISWVLATWGPEALWKVALVILGLSFVILIHELGHFLAAKWCDVHVLAFSLGFGPALPGCSFKRGETTFKVCMIPLGGFVQMVGEGAEADEDENYPRSFKKKTVWQRMLVISAGVIMNVILGFICFIIVYQFHGVPVPPAVVGHVEAGSPAWKQGIRSGTRFTRIGATTNPNLEDLRDNVALSWKDASISVDAEYDGKTREGLSLTPRRDVSDLIPVIGVYTPPRLKLPAARAKKFHELPVGFLSAAAKARVVGLAPGEADVPPGGFEFDDEIVGTTDPDAAPWLEPRTNASYGVCLSFGGGVGIAAAQAACLSKVLDVKELKAKPGDDGGGEKDYFDFQKRMKQLTGLPVVVEVRRQGKAVRLLVPAATHRSFGLTMKMGKVAAVRQGSPAERAGVKEGHVIVGARVRAEGKDGALLELPAAEAPLDPVRLPYDLRRAAAAAKAAKVELTVKGLGTKKDPNNTEAEDKLTLDWDDSWADDEEAPSGPASAMALPELGIAYRVESTVVDVAPGSPADKAKLRKNDQIQQMRFKSGATPSDGKWPASCLPWVQPGWAELKSKRTERGAVQETYDQWAHYDYALQSYDYDVVQVKALQEDGQLREFELTLEPDQEPWPVADRGLYLVGESKLQKADNLLEALGMGASRTGRFIRQLYQQFVSLITGRISTDLVGGPVAIAGQTFEAAEDPFVLILWLGLISVNLAVVNFLPIPMLDGGHMVFLIYELVRRRPPSDKVRAIASYVGLAMILLLLVAVSYQDITKLFK
jgi:regulator of sigma E protease